ncbi:GntR family transcriptional regulator [Martelella soudanensis]|uniref:GntR family transcriptional regulator n=1 Tax=unclassified Martelella TaxID=2629616 RepID=UPI0015DF6241|nr:MULTISPECIES: GntR family transcriptional regulator [unclassified Martelella]
MSIDIHSNVRNEIDPLRPEPIYLQLADIFRRRIMSGLWPALHKLPAEPELAQQLKVSRGTLRSAIALLVQDGLMAQVHGKGTFVTNSARPDPLDGYSLAALLTRSGLEYRTELVSRATLKKNSFYAKLIGEGPYLQLKRRRALPEGPFTVMVNTLSMPICGDIDDDLILGGSLYRALEDRGDFRIGTIRRTLSSIEADEETADLLDLEPGAPVLLIEQVTHLSDGRPFEFATAVIRTDRHRLSMDVNRGMQPLVLRT